MSFSRTIKRLIQLIKEKEQVPIIVEKTNDTLLKDKVALISGGSGGIGKAIAEKLLSSGCRVIISGTNENRMKQICQEHAYKKISYVILNMNRTDLFEEIIDRLNVDIDILINCAGVNDSASFLDVSEETFDKIMDINVKGTYFLSQVIAKRMIRKKIKGHILNLSSSSSLRPASTPYAISKWAITGMTKGLADVLLPYGIIVNAIAPGPTATEMVGKSEIDSISHETCPIGRYALPEEIANLALLMVSEAGDLIVGDTFYISGGSGTISLHR